jgi:hypothetical protein
MTEEFVPSFCNCWKPYLDDWLAVGLWWAVDEKSTSASRRTLDIFAGCFSGPAMQSAQVEEHKH